MPISSAPWGRAGETPVLLWTLDSGTGLSVRISEYGALVQSLWVPGRHGESDNVALGFADLDTYLANAASGGATYFGATVGRYANRIADHSFLLEGRRYETPANNGESTLHGGRGSWNEQVWAARPAETSDGVALTLRHVDPDGHNGFPGQVTAEVTFTVTREAAFRIDYRAVSTATTVINLTNHTYLNLAGEGAGDVLGHHVSIDAGTFLPTDQLQIPTGEFAPVEGTPFDFRDAKPVGRDVRRADQPRGEQLLRARGYDHTWVLNGAGLRRVATVREPGSGRALVLETTEPGLQLYTGNFLTGEWAGTSGRAYRPGDGLALETQHFPDSPHHSGDPGWPSVVLSPGQEFRSTTIFRFLTA